MKILFYCQHILGVGHLFRSLEITKALAAHDVVLVTGGAEIDVGWPSHVRNVALPGLMMDPTFSVLFPAEKNRTLEDVKAERKERLKQIYTEEQPDVFLIELYPFGRNAFRFELLPVLKGIRDGSLPPSRVACSLRDILVEKEDQASYEARVTGILNDYFDALLVHSDPNLIKLDDTFSQLSQVQVSLAYTGFVTPRPKIGARAAVRSELGLRDDDRLIIASAGGGNVGHELLEAAILAVSLMNDHRVHLLVSTGPYMEADRRAHLENIAGNQIKMVPFIEHFPDALAGADLSVSLAGYNTSMNLLAAGVPALVLPFNQNREQRRRAEILAGFGNFGILKVEDLEPSRLKDLMIAALEQGRRTIPLLDLDGAVHTAQWLESWLEAKGIE